MSELRHLAHPALLVGREAELARLRAGLDRALKGRGGLYLLSGEPGIGKTRLAEEAAREANSRGVKSFWGYSTQAEGAPPYWPWMQILGALLAEVGRARFSRLAGHEIDQVLLIVPELRHQFRKSRQTSRDEAGRFQAYAAIVQLLARAADRRPLLIVLEDLHWADAASLILMQQLVPALPHSALMLIGTFRGLEVAPDHPLRLSALDFVRGGDAAEIQLQGLPDADAAALLRDVTDFEPNPELLERIQDQTGGNPFFLMELGRALRDDTTRPADLADLPGPPPERVGSVLRRRIAGLSPACRDTLEYCAVAGQIIDIGLLAQASGVTRSRLLDLFDEAAGGGVLKRDDRGYAFAHGLYRDTVYSGLATARRARLHGRIARTLEQRQAEDSRSTAALAHHFMQAADADESLRGAACKYAVQAAELASAELAYEAAVHHLKVALRVAGSIEQAKRFELLVKLGTAQYLAGDVGGAAQNAQKAADLAIELGDGDYLARAALVVRAVGGPGITPTIRSICEAALRNLPADPALRVQLLSQAVVILMQIGDPESVLRAQPYSEQAMILAKDATDPDIVFAALHARQMATSGPDGVQERLAIADRVLALARESRRVTFESWGHSWRADALVQLGRVDEAEVEVAEQSRTATVLREPLAQWRSLLAQSWIALLRGRFDAARRLSEDARNLGRKGNHPIAEFNYFAHEKAFADLTGRGDYHRDDIAAFARKYPEMTMPFATYEVIELAAEGRLAEARSTLRLIAGVDPEDVRPLMAWLAAMAGIARAASAVGNVEVATSVYRALGPYAGQVVTTTAGLAAVHGAVDRFLGMLASTLDRQDDAARHFEAAIALDRKIGAPPYVAWSEILHAELLLQRGTADDMRLARRLAEDARAISQELGMMPWLQRAKAVIDLLERKGVESHPLSRRELEVAALVAKGLSNHAIAERLHLSVRTAESHVKHICDKLGLNSRSQVAAWVVSRNLGTEIQ